MTVLTMCLQTQPLLFLKERKDTMPTMKGLQKVNLKLYVTEDGYTLKIVKRVVNGRTRTVNYLYDENGRFLSEPLTIADANKQIRWFRKDRATQCGLE